MMVGFPMRLYTHRAEEDLIQILQLLYKERQFWLALRINLSHLAHYDKETQDIVLNLIKGDSENCRGKLFCLRNMDLIFLFPQSEQNSLQAIESKIRHLFIYDPLVCSPSLGVSFSNVSVLAEYYDGLLTECHRNLLDLEKDDLATQITKRDVNLDRLSFSKATETRKTRSRMQVMIVEDHPFIRKMIAKTLETDIEIVQVSNGYDAIETYCKMAPDIVFLDIEMPDLDGHDVLKSLTSLDPDAFIIMLTAQRSCEHVLKAKENHAQGYVMKPFTRIKLQQCIQQYMTKHEREYHASPY
jgi:CheY-like chemotaxis protein